MPPTVNKEKPNVWRVACALYHALCKVRGPRVLCSDVCCAHARPCLSTGWVLNRLFDLTFGTAAVLAQEGGGYCNEEMRTANFPVFSANLFTDMGS